MIDLLIRLDAGEQQGRLVDIRPSGFNWNLRGMNDDPRSPAKFGLVRLDPGGADLGEKARRALRVLGQKLLSREEETRDKRGAFRLQVTPAVVDLFRRRNGLVRVPEDVGLKAFLKGWAHRDTSKDLVEHYMERNGQTEQEAVDGMFENEA